MSDDSENKVELDSQGRPKKIFVNGREINVVSSESKQAEIEQLTRSLEEERAEKEDLASKLTIVAEREFKQRCRRVNLNPELTSPEELKEKEQRTAPEGGQTSSLVGQGYGQVIPKSNWATKEYNSPSELAAEIIAHMHDPDPAIAAEASALWEQIGKKAADTIRKTPLDVEFHGDVHALASRPVKTGKESQEDFEARLKSWAIQRARWLSKGEEK